MSSRNLPAPEAQKVKNRVEKSVQKVEEKELKFPLFDSFLTLFLTFCDPRAGRPQETHFQLRFQLWARRAQELLWGDGRVARRIS